MVASAASQAREDRQVGPQSQVPITASHPTEKLRGSASERQGLPAGARPLKGGFAAAYGDALRAPLTGRSPPGLGLASCLSRIRRGSRLRLSRDLV